MALAACLIEGHGFTEPASWTDEYRRILGLVEASVGPARTSGSAVTEEARETEGAR